MHNLHLLIKISIPLTPQTTAAETYNMTKEVASRDLLKVNIFYTSLNEKIIEDVIEYSLEVEDKSVFVDFSMI